MHLSIEDEQSS